MKYKVRLIKEYIEIADSKEEAIENAKFEFDYFDPSNDSSFCQIWDKVQCRELKAEGSDKEMKDFELPREPRFYEFSEMEKIANSCVALEFSADIDEPCKWQDKNGEWHTGKIFEEFCKKFPNIKVDDYRPA